MSSMVHTSFLCSSSQLHGRPLSSPIPPKPVYVMHQYPWCLSIPGTTVRLKSQGIPRRDRPQARSAVPLRGSGCLCSKSLHKQTGQRSDRHHVSPSEALDHPFNNLFKVLAAQFVLRPYHIQLLHMGSVRWRGEGGMHCACVCICVCACAHIRTT